MSNGAEISSSSCRSSTRRSASSTPTTRCVSTRNSRRSSSLPTTCPQSNELLRFKDLFPFASAPGAAAYTYQQAVQFYGADYVLREPRKTFRFTVATTF